MITWVEAEYFPLLAPMMVFYMLAIKMEFWNMMAYSPQPSIIYSQAISQ